MTTTITYPGGTPIVPDFAALGSLNAEVVSRTITHEILDGPPVHTLQPAKPQTGTLLLEFSTATRAHAAKDRLTAAAVYTVISDDSPHFPGRIIVRRVTVTQRDTASDWVVTVDYEEVNQ